jgi:hypothetical protein
MKMKRIFFLAMNYAQILFLPEIQRVIIEKKLTNRAIKVMIWSRIVLKLLMWFVALFFIARFAMLMRSVFFN